MALSQKALEYHVKMFPHYESSLMQSDPEFVELFDNFAFDEVIEKSILDGRMRFICILSILLGSQSIDEFITMVSPAMEFGVTPVEIKEVIYQSVAYLGFGRVSPFLKAVNQLFELRGIVLPLKGQKTTTIETRLKKGEEAQVNIFGEHMLGFSTRGKEDMRHINYFLTSQCFGDYYTRKGLNYKEREMITFCFLYAQGDCVPQLKSHISANINCGTTRAELIDIITQGIPYIGYPRTLNALACIEAVTKGE